MLGVQFKRLSRSKCSSAILLTVEWCWLVADAEADGVWSAGRFVSVDVEVAMFVVGRVIGVCGCVFVDEALYSVEDGYGAVVWVSAGWGLAVAVHGVEDSGVFAFGVGVLFPFASAFEAADFFDVVGGADRLLVVRLGYVIVVVIGGGWELDCDAAVGDLGFGGGSFGLVVVVGYVGGVFGGVFFAVICGGVVGGVGGDDVARCWVVADGGAFVDVLGGRVSCVIVPLYGAAVDVDCGAVRVGVFDVFFVVRADVGWVEGFDLATGVGSFDFLVVVLSVFECVVGGSPSVLVVCVFSGGFGGFAGEVVVSLSCGFFGVVDVADGGGDLADFLVGE